MMYLFAAFSVVWLALFVYLFSLSRRQQSLVREVEALRQLLAKQEQVRLGG